MPEHPPRTTVLAQAMRELPVQTLRIDVTSGAAAGASVTNDSSLFTVGSADGNTLVLSDPTVSRYHLELRHVGEGVRVTDVGSTNGTFVGQLRIENGVVPLGTELRLGHSTLVVHAGGTSKVALHGEDALGGLRGQTPVMRSLMATIAKAAPTDAPVLITGESGTGKELIARALHDHSSRRDQQFVTVDCGSLSPTLVASELFGHERGAFTGAVARHVGAFESAAGGTLFLDEIGDLPGPLQPVLLGALERGRFKRVGGREDVAVDVRVVAATHRDLRADVNRGVFRLDLYYRLAVVVLTSPPLRERAADIPLLAEHFLRTVGHSGSLEALFPKESLERLLRHSWPGNVRELRNLMQAASALGEAPALDATTTPSAIDDAGDVSSLPYRHAKAAVLADFERRYAENLLRRADGNVSQAARMGEMDRMHLTDLLRRHGLR